MSSPTRDIEKESLEAHVELCAARYSRLEEKLDNLEGRVIGIETVLGEIRDTIVKDREKRQTQHNLGCGYIQECSSIFIQIVQPIKS